MKTNNPSYDKLNLAINLEVGLFGNKLSHNKKKLGLLENRFKLTKPQKHKGQFKIWTKLESRVFI